MVLQMDIIKGGNKSTVIDASRSYLAVLYPRILSPTFSFSKLPPLFDSVLALIPGLCCVTPLMKM